MTTVTGNNRQGNDSAAPAPEKTPEREKSSPGEALCDVLQAKWARLEFQVNRLIPSRRLRLFPVADSFTVYIWPPIPPPL